jgi:glycosyltransferase involved in cell wall biosynthesis
MTAELSVVVPVYNRGEIIRYALESIARASVDLEVEVIVVDDGSNPPTAEVLEQMHYKPAKVIRQANKGLLFARLTGLAAATGENLLFLDSDDLVSSDKFRTQLAAMHRHGAEISYSDTAKCILEGDFDDLVVTPDEPALETTDGSVFCIVVQPAPHSPIFRTEWLRRVVLNPLFPPSSLYNNVAEIWFYHNAAVVPARAVHVSGAHAITGVHLGSRLTNNWEKLACGSLAVMEAFARSCPPAYADARRLVGEAAFRSWRRLPRNFNSKFSERLLDIWRTLGSPHSTAVGGPWFQMLSRVLSPEYAGRLFRIVQASSYEACRTISDDEFELDLRKIGPI